jgi:CheY-like chemotaxis protein
LDGYDVVREIRQASDTAGLCIVALKACAMNGDRDSALEAGFDGFITKPVGVASLRDQVTGYHARRSESCGVDSTATGSSGAHGSAAFV